VAVRRFERHDLRHPDGRRVFVYGHIAEAAHLNDAPTGADAIHQRLDLVTGEWVAISPARNRRPHDRGLAPAADACPLCPGGAELPFAYEAAVFENRFPSFMADPPDAPAGTRAVRSVGRCEVVVYTARHDASFGGLSADEAARVLAIWTDRSSELWRDPAHDLVLVFENRGVEAGATLAHPHGQIYAFDHVPPRVETKVRGHRRFREAEGSCLGCALTADGGARQIEPNESFAVEVPYAARWPYEVAVRARRHGVGRLADLTGAEQADLMDALRSVALRYDLLFSVEMPYLMVAQEAPRDVPDWHLAFEFYPLRRSASATKIRASVETATGLFLNDVLPEDAALRLRSLQVAIDPFEVAER
jgi:UDPglucose--hexose-1-phosphate uridylyltransferase